MGAGTATGGPELVIARYGELWLKGGNRPQFERRLARNLRAAVRSVTDARVERLHGMLVVYPEGRTGDVARRMQQVFGLSSVSPAWSVEPEPEAIAAVAPVVLGEALERFERGRTVAFRVETKRSDKGFPMISTELDRFVADRLADEQLERLRVDLSHPELRLEVHVRRERAYVFAERLPGAGGLPVGSLGRVLCLLSGGIDSPVAAWLAMKRGCEVGFVSFHSYPYLGESAREKIRRLVRALSRWQRRSRLWSVPFTRIQEEIRDACPEGYRTLLYRRMMQRIAGRLAEREGAGALVTGESLGQVASQTLENLRCIEAASDHTVLRPLVTYDKQETIALARRLGTYELSIQPEPDCCTVFQPRGPVLRATPERCLAAEGPLDVDDLVAEAVEGTEIVAV